MQTTKKIFCAWCGRKKRIVLSEYNRQIRTGHTRFFCNSSCCAKQHNSERNDLRKEIIKRCPFCKKRFMTVTGSHTTTFCSRSCASAGSVTASRRRAGRTTSKKNFIPATLAHTARTLRSREAWKYKRLKRLLRGMDEKFRFEYVVAGYIFDLALSKRKVLIEFDGLYHEDATIKNSDRKKSKEAEKEGWRVVRIKTPSNEIINPKVLFRLLASFT